VRLGGERRMPVCQSGMYLDVHSTECRLQMHRQALIQAARRREAANRQSEGSERAVPGTDTGFTGTGAGVGENVQDAHPSGIEARNVNPNENGVGNGQPAPGGPLTGGLGTSTYGNSVHDEEERRQETIQSLVQDVQAMIDQYNARSVVDATTESATTGTGGQ